MADLQSYRFEPGRVSNPEDSESENEEVNDRFRRHILVFFWAMSCQRKENGFVAENSQRKKTKFKVKF